MLTHTPRPVAIWVEEVIFQVHPDATGIRAYSTASRESCCIAPEKVGFLLVHISESWEIPTSRSTPRRGVLRMPFVLSRHASAVIVESHILAQYPTVVAQTIRETSGSRIQQDGVGIQSSSIDKEYVCIKFFDFLGQAIDDADTCSLAFCLVVDYLMHHRIRSDGQIACLQCQRDGGRVGTKVASKRTATLA